MKVVMVVEVKVPVMEVASMWVDLERKVSRGKKKRLQTVDFSA